MTQSPASLGEAGTAGGAASRTAKADHIEASPAQAGWAFGPFTLDLGRRELARDGMPVELGSRYFDALVILLDSHGAVVSKAEFMDRAWHGVPVTDEALTQAIRSLRKALGDDAGSPSYIATVPKHGYRFIAPLERLEPSGRRVSPNVAVHARPALPAASAIGGTIAGVTVGTAYGAFVAAPAGGSVLSGLLVMVTVGVIAGLVAGLGIGIGLALAQRWLPRAPLSWLAGGLIGGLATGALGRMLALDGFGLLLGSSLSAMTGALEGAVMGLAIGAALAVPPRPDLDWRGRALLAGIAGALGAALLSTLGGRLLGGSLADLGAVFAGSRLRLDALGPLFGETGFGPVTMAATGIIEGFVFCACVTGAIARMSFR